MGGAIAQLITRDHPDVVDGVILSGTAQHWQEQELRRIWKAMPSVGFGLSLAPGHGWRLALKRNGIAPGPSTAWLHSEMKRHNARDMAEAGRELGRFDSRPWLAPLPVPAAVVLTTVDDAVPPAKQHELAAALDATVFEAPVRHLEVAAMADAGSAERYNPALLAALEHVRAAEASGSLPAMSRKRTAAIALSVVASMLALRAVGAGGIPRRPGHLGPDHQQADHERMFIIMGLFIVLIIVFSLLQSWLEHRKHGRVDAAKRRESSAQWKGGW